MISSFPIEKASILSDHAIDIKGLVKTYAIPGQKMGRRALRGVDLVIPRGSLYGLLGPNGAGKSTLINILAGLTLKTAGRARVCGYDVAEDERQARVSIGVVPQELNLDAFFTVREIIVQQAGFYGVAKPTRRVDELLEILDLTDVADMPVRSLSGGMRRRLMVAKAMVHNPPVLVLDEPTAGVDIELRYSIWEHVKKLNKAGTTILLTTHYLEEAEELCSHIAIMSQGALVANEPKAELLARMDHKRMTVFLAREIDDLPGNLRKNGWEKVDARAIRLVYKPTKTSIGSQLLSVQANGLSIADISTEETSLEDVFLQLTKLTEPALPLEKEEVGV